MKMPIMGSNKYIRTDLLLFYHVKIQMYLIEPDKRRKDVCILKSKRCFTCSLKRRRVLCLSFTSVKRYSAAAHLLQDDREGCAYIDAYL